MLNASLLNQLMLTLGIINPERLIEIYRDDEAPAMDSVFDEHQGFMYPLSFVSFRRNLEGNVGEFKNCVDKEELLEKLWQKTTGSKESWDEVVGKYSFEYYTTLSTEERKALYTAAVDEKPYHWRKEIRDKLKSEFLEGVSSWTAHEWLNDEMSSTEFEDLVTKLFGEKKSELLAVYDFLSEEEQAEKLFELCCDDDDPGISFLDAYCYAVKKIFGEVKRYWLIIPVKAKMAFDEWSLKPMDLNFQSFRKANAFFIAEKDVYRQWTSEHGWTEEELVEKTIEQIKGQIREFQECLNRNSWRAYTICDDEVVDKYSGFYGEFDQVLQQIRSELKPEFKLAFDAGYVTVED